MENTNIEKILLSRLITKEGTISKFAKKYMDFLKTCDKMTDSEL